MSTVRIAHFTPEEDADLPSRKPSEEERGVIDHVLATIVPEMAVAIDEGRTRESGRAFSRMVVVREIAGRRRLVVIRVEVETIEANA